MKMPPIFGSKSHGVYENVMVETGAESDGTIEIKTALDPTKKVVITGAYAINSSINSEKGMILWQG
jgi:Cu(I)/Ag(I) efflux system membrane fusion protein